MFTVVFEKSNETTEGSATKSFFFFIKKNLPPLAYDIKKCLNCFARRNIVVELFMCTSITVGVVIIT